VIRVSHCLHEISGMPRRTTKRRGGCTAAPLMFHALPKTHGPLLGTSFASLSKPCWSDGCRPDPRPAP
jgi:hypothetical protein